MDHKTNIHELKELVKDFCNERDWDQFHNAKELAIGISTEAGELLDIFRFKSEEQMNALFQNDERRQQISNEMADVFYFLIRMAQKYNIDLTSELRRKIKINAQKYPVEKAKGCNKKYNEY